MGTCAFIKAPIPDIRKEPANPNELFYSFAFVRVTQRDMCLSLGRKSCTGIIICARKSFAPPARDHSTTAGRASHNSGLNSSSLHWMQY